MLPSRIRTYTVQGIAGTPAILKRLLQEVPNDSPRGMFALTQVACSLKFQGVEFADTDFIL